ncbi:MAG: hypothetical protein GY811_30495, partial [Myxococcales bacterium]|nr:hypothetical protein [Myxococcales bacterium]
MLEAVGLLAAGSGLGWLGSFFTNRFKRSREQKDRLRDKYGEFFTAQSHYVTCATNLSNAVMSLGNQPKAIAEEHGPEAMMESIQTEMMPYGRRYEEAGHTLNKALEELMLLEHSSNNREVAELVASAVWIPVEPDPVQ